MEEIIIKEYIEFAIENGFNNGKLFAYKKGKDYFGEVLLLDEKSIKEYLKDKQWKIYCRYNNLIELITSKEFIDAIARGYIKNNNPTKYGEVEGIGKYKSEHGVLNIYDEIVQQIIHLQGKAIYNNELPLFIKKILGKN